MRLRSNQTVTLERNLKRYSPVTGLKPTSAHGRFSRCRLERFVTGGQYEIQAQSVEVRSRKMFNAPDMKSVPSREAGLWLTVVGVMLEVLGLGLDVILHTLDANLAAREGIFSLNPGHLLFLTGLSLSIFAVIAGFTPRSRMGFWVGAGMVMAAFNVALLARGEAFTPHSHAQNLQSQHLHSLADAGGATTRSSVESKLTWAQLRQTNRSLERIKNATLKYKNLKLAVADGYKQEGISRQGAGAHFINRTLLEAGKFNLEHPTFLLYERQTDWSLELVGVGWLLPKKPNDTPPTHLAPLAAWHYHDYPAPGVCTWLDGTLNTASLEDCRAEGGRHWPQSPWMLHAWVHRSSPEGVFSLVNSNVKGPLIADLSAISPSNK
jgi:hypothetical protein